MTGQTQEHCKSYQVPACLFTYYSLYNGPGKLETLLSWSYCMDHKMEEHNDCAGPLLLCVCLWDYNGLSSKVLKIEFMVRRSRSIIVWHFQSTVTKSWHSEHIFFRVSIYLKYSCSIFLLKKVIKAHPYPQLVAWFLKSLLLVRVFLNG